MNRKDFIKTCGLSCLAVTGVATLLESCTSNKYIQVPAENNLLKVAKTELQKDTDKPGKLLRHLLIKTDKLNFPVVLYRFSDTEYAALLLQCSHQSAELSVNGDLLTCPAHGSEFNNTGEVIQGPAEHALKRYRVTQDKEHIYIYI
jgi:nitrite reductase/ring-hydroxylating ferredoxin subunit